MFITIFSSSRKLYLPLLSCFAISLLVGVQSAHAADKKISTGLSHSCLVTEEKTVECWGDNSFGKLGRTGSSKLKGPVPGLTNVRSVGVGDNHSCAFIEGGEIKCWGANTEGQLAQPASITSSATPLTVTTWASDLAVGAGHSCAVTGTVVQCWGRNSSGQLGSGTFYPFANGLRLVMENDRGPLRSVDNLIAGTNHTCGAVNGQLYCWGANNNGQLGYYGTTYNSAYPVFSSLSGNVISAGTNHTCAGWEHDPYLECVGNWGQPTTALYPQFINLQDPANPNDYIVNIDSGYNHVCAIFNNGKQRCFGQNLDGQLGNGAINTYVATPVAISGISSPAVAISAGGSSTCSMLANGSVACWGLNGAGQLGDSTHRRAVSAVSAGWWKNITPAVGVKAVGLGYSHTCALKNNQVKCWGNNINGQVGNAIPTGTSPAAVTTTPVVVGGLTGNIISLVSGNLHNCVLIDDGSVKCWGGNNEGQLGNGVITSTAQPLPVDVIGLSQPATAIMAAGDFTCAALQDKTAKCWGSNSHGQLGAGVTIPRSADPLTVYDLFNVTALSGKMVHACALLEDKSTKCWGANYTGQLGDGTTTNRNIPVANATWIKDVVRISAGTNNTCILRSANNMWCWGNINGNGNATVAVNPTDVASLFNVASVSAGDFNSCAVISNGTVKCFGGDNALLGDGAGVSSSGNSYFPNSIRWLVAPATEIVHGRNGNACAILVTGQLSCWGNNGFGKLGDGTQVTRHEPVVVNL